MFCYLKQLIQENNQFINQQLVAILSGKFVQDSETAVRSHVRLTSAIQRGCLGMLRPLQPSPLCTAPTGPVHIGASQCNVMTLVMLGVLCCIGEALLEVFSGILVHILESLLRKHVSP